MQNEGIHISLREIGDLQLEVFKAIVSTPNGLEYEGEEGCCLQHNMDVSTCSLIALRYLLFYIDRYK